MALVKINEKTLIQKIKHLILGKEKPNFITRLSVLIGFGLWLFFSLWQTFILLSIILAKRLRNPEMITDTLNRIGNKYAFMHRWGLDTTNTLIINSIGLLILFGLSLIGLILIYKQKKRGYILYLIANTSAIAFTYVFLGHQYFIEQISLIDQILFAAITLYFLIGLFIIPKTK